MLVISLGGALLWLLFRKIDAVRNFVNKIWRKIFWNSFIRMVLETSIEIAIASMIKTFGMSISSPLETASSIYTVVSLVVLVGLAFAIPFFLHKKGDALNSEKFD